MASWSRAAVPARDKKVLTQALNKGQTLIWACCPEALDVGLDIKFVGELSPAPLPSSLPISPAIT